MSRFLHASLALSFIIWLPICTQAHMQMSWPYPLRSPLDPDVPVEEKDYDMTSPLLADGSNFPCKNYQNDTDGYVTKATYISGGTYDMWLNGTIEHDGGSCQLSLSYDNGVSFKVIKSMIGGCPLTHNYNFTIPSFAPSSDSALLSWSWFNLIGNREMYQNCARVQIIGGPTKRYRRASPYRRQASSMNQLPDMFVCNVGNGCQTIERQEVVFPDPGYDVVYGQDAIVPDPGPGFTIQGAAPSTSSSETLATTTVSVTDGSLPISTSTSTSSDPVAPSTTESTTSTSSSVYLLTSTTSSTSQTSPSSFTGMTTFDPASSPVSSGFSTTTISRPGSAAMFFTTLSTNLTTTTASPPPFPLANMTTTSFPFPSGTSFPNTNSTGTMIYSNFFTTSPTTTMTTTTTASDPAIYSTTTMTTFTTLATSTLTSTLFAFSFTSATQPTTFMTSTRVASTSTSTSTSSTSSTSPTSLPLPCVPGTFTCNTPFSFSQCIATTTGTTYIYMGSVALGTTCVNGQIIRENDGPCTPNGALFCNGETSFYLCDQGGLVDMGPVAPGTICLDGEIVAA